MILGILLTVLGVTVAGAAVAVALEKTVFQHNYKDAAIVLIFAFIPGVVTIAYGLNAIV